MPEPDNAPSPSIKGKKAKLLVLAKRYNMLDLVTPEMIEDLETEDDCKEVESLFDDFKENEDKTKKDQSKKLTLTMNQKKAGETNIDLLPDNEQQKVENRGPPIQDPMDVRLLLRINSHLEKKGDKTLLYAPGARLLVRPDENGNLVGW